MLHSNTQVVDIHAPFKIKMKKKTLFFDLMHVQGLMERLVMAKSRIEDCKGWRNSKLEVHHQLFVKGWNKTHKLIVGAKKNHLGESLNNPHCK